MNYLNYVVGSVGSRALTPASGESHPLTLRITVAAKRSHTENTMVPPEN